jgi:cyclohexanecarboxylate-CoA ligase
MNDVSKAHQAYHESGWWRDQTFLDDLHRHATQQPGKTAVIGRNTATGQTDKVDYAELSRQTDRMALGLVGLGIRRGEYICVLLPDYWEMFPWSWPASRRACGSPWCRRSTGAPRWSSCSG